MQKLKNRIKPWSHRQCDCNEITLWPLKLANAKKSQRSQRGFIKVSTRSPIANSLLSVRKRMAATYLVAQRFHWPLRSCEAVLFSSQIGFRQFSDQFRVEKGGDSLQCSGNVSVTDQKWGSDQSVSTSSVTSCQLIAKWIASMRRSYGNWFTNISSTCLCITASFS